MAEEVLRLELFQIVHRRISRCRSVSGDAVLVIAGTSPWVILDKIRKRTREGLPMEMCEELLNDRQIEWDESPIGRWTHRLKLRIR